MESEKAKILPFYVLIDVSASMSGRKLDEANQIMPQVVDALAEAPILADKVRFCVIDFGSDAQVRLPLCDVLDQHSSLPPLTIRGATSYAAAFRLLRSEIEINVKQLKADGYLVHRPAVFFISDGEPTDPEHEWRTAFQELTGYDKASGQGFSTYPNFVPCGVDQANPRTLATLIHPASGPKQMQMYLMEQGQNPADAIAAIAEILISSMLASGQSMAQGSSGMILPAKQDLPPGISAHSSDDFV
ncbi:VWA domain-containing protein [Lentzea sp. BCCO 10_0856]|uniref:VWA domain-containing protein n=1 Tax=Lentzea miocenica TaxID=3095431 RepID=A0ABU4SYT0_9PSEU|nr:VWA domain-containing protein [Lentzea sp. BCCO 10_0856]MDX8031061.1 VWA domain-containing protein [Lentzea sp. BCCO 10_0856]